jgi:hypothetical protein
MKKIIYTLLSLTFVLAIGCQKDPYPYITLNDVKAIDSVAHPAVKGAAFIYNGNVYFVNDFTKPATQITTDGSAAKFVKVSHDYSKFAYLNSGNQIMVVSNKGAVLTTLSQYTQVKSFDWSADDKTLYILNGDAMAYYGPAMNLPDLDFESFNKYSDQEVVAASVSLKGDLAYIVSAFDFNIGTRYELIISPADKSKAIEYVTSEFDGTAMDYVNFSAHNQDLVVGYGSGVGAVQQRLELFTDLASYPTDNTGGYHGATPVYNSALDYIVAGGQNDDGSISPAAIYLGEKPIFADASVPQTIILNKYSLTGGILYTDWK